MKLPETHQELMEMILGGELTNNELLEIAKAHTHRDWECAVCSIEEDEDDWPLFELIFNNYKESLSTEVLEYLAANFSEQCDPATWEYAYLFTMLDFGLHPRSSEEVLNGSSWALERRETLGFEDGDEPERKEYGSYFKRMTQHPLADDQLVDDFLGVIHRLSEQIGCFGSVDACEACQSLRDSYWDK